MEQVEFARAAEQSVIAVAALELHRAKRRDQSVVALAADQRQNSRFVAVDDDVAGLGAFDAFDTGVSVTLGVAGAVGGVTDIDPDADGQVGIAGLVLVAVATDEFVLARAADQQIIVAVADQEVDAVAALQRVLAFATGDEIVPRLAQQPVFAGVAVSLCRCQIRR